MARWAERAAVEVNIQYTNATVWLMRWRMHHRSRHGDVRGRDVAAGQLLGHRTRAESYACPDALEGYQALDVSTVTGAPCV